MCLIRAKTFWAVGFWYEHFPQTTDDEVRDLLAQAEHEWMAMPQE